MKKVLFSLGLFLPFLYLSACTHPLSKEARLSVDPDAYFELARENPEAYTGKTFLLGGIIIANHATQKESSLEILSYDLDFQDKPLQPNEKKGRFLARSEKFLDPALYQNNRLVTLIGTLTGQEKHSLNGNDYSYPVFEIGEIYLWPREPERRPYPPYYHYPYPYYPYYYYPYHPYSPYRRHPYYRYW